MEFSGGNHTPEIRTAQHSKCGLRVSHRGDERIPSAKALTTEHLPLVGVIAGLILMMVNLYLLG